MKGSRQSAHGLLGFAALSLSACVGSPDGGESDAGSFNVEQVKKELLPLTFERGRSHPAAAIRYFKYYGLDIAGAEHGFGTFSSGGYVLAAHVFTPPESKGTVVVLHGYYDHAGILRHLIRSLVEAGYTVATYDHPGHGLSTGERASIEDFSEYVSVLEDFLKLCRTRLRGPFHLVAHSMGCGVATDHLLNAGRTSVEKIVFLAPLIRSAAWDLAGWGRALVGDRVDSVPRKFRKNCSDKAFLKFVKDDPLQTDRVPMKWVKALRAWNDRVVKYEPSGMSLRIIQGASDTTVDDEYNLALLRKKFNNPEVVMIKKGGHQLMNEPPPIRSDVLEHVTAYLGSKPDEEAGR